MKRLIIPTILLILVLSISGCTTIPGSPTGFNAKSCKPDFKKTVFPTWPGSGKTAIEYLEFVIGVFGWLHETNLLFCVIIPILGVFFVTYGFLETIRIFKIPWINVALAILMALTFTSLSVLNRIIGMLFQGMGLWGIIVFSLMFFVGTWLLYRRRQAEWGTQAGVASAFKEETRTLRHQLRVKRREYSMLVHQLAESENVCKN